MRSSRRRSPDGCATAGTKPSIADVGLVGATDAEIAVRAERSAAVLVTKDEDFTAIRLPDRFALL